MAHNLDTNDGVTSFVSARVDAWHQLGVVLPETFTATEALKHGGLADWNLRKAAMTADAGDGRLVEIPDRYAVLRDNPVIPGQVDPLGVVGERYRIMPNESLTDLLDALVDESGANYETAGAIDGGRKVFVSMKLPDHMMIGGEDRIDNYITAMTSHDGTTATEIMVTPIRVVCQNTLNVAMKGSKNRFQVRHTSSAEKVVLSQARRALDLTFGYLEEFQALAETMIETEMTEHAFDELISAEFGAPDDAAEATITRSTRRLETMSDLFRSASTQENIRGSAWAGFNALTEWNDHYSPVRGEISEERSTRARRALLKPEFKDRARRAVADFVLA